MNTNNKNEDYLLKTFILRIPQAPSTSSVFMVE
jgi:hypothetical protein